MRDKKFWIVIAIIIILIVGVVVIFTNTNTRTSDDIEETGGIVSEGVQTGVLADNAGLQTACGALTEGVAKEVLGKDAVEATNPIDAQASTADIALSNCSYTTTTDDTFSATILVQGAKSAAAPQMNISSFEAARTQTLDAKNDADSTRISGLGSDAYYNPSLGQVNVLAQDGKYWIIAQVRKGDIAQQPLAEKLARLIVEKL